MDQEDFHAWLTSNSYLIGTTGNVESLQFARMFYDLREDFQYNNNIAKQPEHKDVIRKLNKRL